MRNLMVVLGILTSLITGMYLLWLTVTSTAEVGFWNSIFTGMVIGLCIRLATEFGALAVQVNDEDEQR